MKVLLIGSGGREHALAWKISVSPLLSRLYCAPGNPGTAEIAKNIDLNVADHAAVVRFCVKKHIDLVMIGPEAPLVNGLADSLRNSQIRVVGPGAKAARLEGSKGFTKDLCARFSIPTAAYGRFKNMAEAKAYIYTHGAPIVVKADGLAAGKGVIVAMTIKEALAAVDACFDGAFGTAGTEVVVEEFLQGEEASFFCLCDGTIAFPFGTAQDYKQIGEGDTGLNTGGMGAYSPAFVMTSDMVKCTMRRIIEPTMKAMITIGTPFKGILFAGLMITKDGPNLIEYNVRFGDPECQVLMMRLQNDLLPLLVAAADGKLSTCKQPTWSDDISLTVVLAAKGYPEAPEKGSFIEGIEEAAALPDIVVLHAGTALQNGRLVTNSGRVLNVTTHDKTLRATQRKAYAAIRKIRCPGGFWRSDIGWRAYARED
ncbi:MAG: phosphoribosylamine--glycine ligase [Candidatus Tokpelaia sp. JSC188]|nr:MAG: phosphoribosylamine--glycine ligase [Candidatus Tokpelaia sp. JSC188]